MMQHADLPIPHFPGLAGRQISWARADDFVTTPPRRLFAWWKAHAENGLPRREDFDIVEFADIAEYLYIIERVESGFELRLAGEEYIRIFGLKKGWVWQFDSADPVMQDSARLMQFMTDSGRPMRTMGRLELIERHWIELEALICPLAPLNGAPRILGCTCLLPQS